MEYKTSEAKRKANSEYRKRNKEKERNASYRRTSKLYLLKHATFLDLLDFQRYIFERIDEIISSDQYSDNEKEEFGEIYQKMLKKYEGRKY
ncbi:hypothetical protein NGG16_16405 [Enterococcus casseliflavus]|uniref:hypothetical protein n=1 Tax=Enterococcus casseliflavus TaxID=37734 RepID=UPI002DB8F737|nr:hypothetical protein [Enterococcus casseliflavus]MEB8419018.1 hypothetical protein [Enterococcus casseliflavus]